MAQPFFELLALGGGVGDEGREDPIGSVIIEYPCYSEELYYYFN
jgi:hypothetical protein